MSEQMEQDYRRDQDTIRRYRRAATALGEVLAANRVLSHESRRIFLEAQQRCESRAEQIESSWN